MRATSLRISCSTAKVSADRLIRTALARISAWTKESPCLLRTHSKQTDPFIAGPDTCRQPGTPTRGPPEMAEPLGRVDIPGEHMAPGHGIRRQRFPVIA